MVGEEPICTVDVEAQTAKTVLPKNIQVRPLSKKGKTQKSPRGGLAGFKTLCQKVIR